MKHSRESKTAARQRDWLQLRPPICRRPDCSNSATDEVLTLCPLHAKQAAANQPGDRIMISAGAEELLLGLLRRPEWHRRATCRGVGTDGFFPEITRGQRLDYSSALEMCARCPVQAQCAEAGQSETAGLWGGVPKRKRRYRPSVA